MDINRRALDAIVRHARDVSPNECCGVLLGTGDRIEEAVAARNIADRPAARFLIDPLDHFAAIRFARARSLDVVGFYHSHPHAAAVPSDTDVSEANYPHSVMLIVGLASDPADVRLYRLEDGNFRSCPLVTVA